MEQDEVKQALEAGVADGMLQRVGDNAYALTRRGQVQAKHAIRTNPDAARFYLALLCKDLGVERAREAICKLGERYMDRIDDPSGTLSPGWQQKIVAKARDDVKTAEFVAEALLTMADDDEIALEMGAALVSG